MTVEPMTDAPIVDPPMTDSEWADVRAYVERCGYLLVHPEDNDDWNAFACRIAYRLIATEAERDAERSRADAAEAERDAALARAMPGWRYLATWDAVNTVEARHNDEPAPGLYAIWKPGWPYPSAASVQFGVFATDEESPAPDDYLLGAWISGPLPLPDLPTPTAAQEG